MKKLFISIVVYRTNINILNSCLTSLGYLSNKSHLYIWDNSKDPLLFKFCNEKNINYSASENIGFGAGHNKNIKKFCYKKDFDNILILNPDVIIKPNNIEQLIKTLAYNQKNYQLISPLLMNPDGTLQNSIRLLPNFFDFIIRFINPTHKKYKIVKNKVFSVPFIHGACYLIKLDYLKSINFFDERFFLYCEDLDLCRKIIESKGLIAVDPNIKVTHLYNKQSHRSLKLFFVHIRSIIQYFLKWGLFNNLKTQITNKKFIDYLDETK